jgi:predicted DNA-binding ribbon-helix-helix protein
MCLRGSLFWAALREIADTEGLKLTELIAHIDKDRNTPNLSSAVRLFVMDYYVRLAKAKSGEDDPKGKCDGAD